MERAGLPCFMLSTHLTLYYVHSSARLYFGRGALMAKALGTTPEEEHRPGLAPLARVSDSFIINHKIIPISTLFSK
jgi:hypothetical protein